MRNKIQLALIMLIVMAILLPVAAHAALVGHFTQVRGQVDLLKGGKIPGLRVKVQDGVEPGDVIRTKARAKAELTMLVHAGLDHRSGAGVPPGGGGLYLRSCQRRTPGRGAPL